MTFFTGALTTCSSRSRSPSTRLMPVEAMVAIWLVKKITSRRVTRSKKRTWERSIVSSSVSPAVTRN